LLLNADFALLCVLGNRINSSLSAQIEVNWNMTEQFVVEQHQTVLITDSLNSSRPLTRNVSSQSQIGTMGDTITYAKGASIVRMMSLTFGTELFKFALRDYLQDK